MLAASELRGSGCSREQGRWAVLCLWHCRMRNDIVAKRSFQVLMERVMPDLDLLLEVGWAMLPVHVPFSFAAARRALSIRDEGLGLRRL